MLKVLKYVPMYTGTNVPMYLCEMSGFADLQDPFSFDKIHSSAFYFLVPYT